ncbi:hypothetical protein SK128_016498, partial [Halocaridina rubra]
NLMMSKVVLQRCAVFLGALAVLQMDCCGIEMDELRVKCDVASRYVITHITASTVNRRKTSQEIPLRLTLPKNAYVTSLVM